MVGLLKFLHRNSFAFNTFKLFIMLKRKKVVFFFCNIEHNRTVYVHRTPHGNEDKTKYGNKNKRLEEKVKVLHLYR